MPRLLFVCLAMSGCFSAKGPTLDTKSESAPEEASLVERPPIKPTNFQAKVQGQTVSLSWDAISGARKYHMQWAAVAAPHVVLGKASITTPNLKVRDLDEGRYIFHVAQETTRGPGPMESLEATIE
ncbi:hypothetical protein [Oligoflexus tunisiensis]|uniref:hypothetical protein n=1 Tax=Oligoflexus tunisiensis TaxID=708132 RepID=UPI00114CF674|nr:hypothetical protein [Oligoflexus tunisiensis]